MSAAVAAYRAARQNIPFTKLHWNVANITGIESALLIEIIQDWCDNNMIHQRKQYFHNDHWWTKGTYQEWESKYPSLGSARTLQRLLLRLESDEYVLAVQFNKGKDNTKFYRVNEEKVGELYLQGLEEFRKSTMPNWHDETDVSNPSCQSVTTQDANLARSSIYKQINKTDHFPPLPPQGGSLPIQELKILEDGQENQNTLATTRHANTLTLEKAEVTVPTQIIIPGVDVPPPAKKTSAKKPQLDEEFFEPLRLLYNSSKPDRWQGCIKLNKKKISAFKRLYEELGDRTAQTMQEALCFVNHDRWWRETYSNPCLDGLLVSGRVQQLSDCYKASSPNAEYNADTGEIGVIDPDTGDRITDPNHIAILKGLGRI